MRTSDEIGKGYHHHILLCFFIPLVQNTVLSLNTFNDTDITKCALKYTYTK